MKLPISRIVVLLCVTTFIVGCGKQPAERGVMVGDELTASELARLMDFHAWKIRVPSSAQPFTQVRLVILKSDGSVTPVFQTSVTVGGMTCSSILLGFRAEHGTCSGHLDVRESDGGGLSWRVNFADPFMNSSLAWTRNGGSLEWKDNRVQIALATTNGDPMPSALAMELVK